MNFNSAKTKLFSFLLILSNDTHNFVYSVFLRINKTQYFLASIVLLKLIDEINYFISSDFKTHYWSYLSFHLFII
jgi:hypothetical protein